MRDHNNMFVSRTHRIAFLVPENTKVCCPFTTLIQSRFGFGRGELFFFFFSFFGLPGDQTQCSSRV